MTDTQRVTDERVASYIKQCEDAGQSTIRIWDGLVNILLDLRDARALAQSQAATIAERDRKAEELEQSCAIYLNQRDFWKQDALSERRLREAAESALATANAKIEHEQAEFAKLSKSWSGLSARIEKLEAANREIVVNQMCLYSRDMAVISERALQEDKPHD